MKKIPEQLKNLNIIPLAAKSKIPIKGVKVSDYYEKKFEKELSAEKFGGDINYGIICGKTSNNLVIVDFDQRELYDKYFSDINSFAVETPSGGVHLYLFSGLPLEKQVGLEGLPIDIQGQRSHAVIPPSYVVVKDKEGNIKYEEEYKVLKDSKIKNYKDILSLLKKRLPKIGKKRKVKKEQHTFIDEIKKEASLSEVVEKYVNPEVKPQKGGYWKGLCPFHQETTPSFTVYEDNYYCFGCGASGDAINFIQDVEGLDFKEAVKWLCKEYNIDPPKNKEEEKEEVFEHHMKEAIDALDKEEKPVVESPIAFVDGGLYYLIEMKSFSIEEGEAAEKKKTVKFLGVLGSAHSITIAPGGFHDFYAIAQDSFYSESIAHLPFELESVEFTYLKDQGVLLRRCHKEGLSNNGKVCKPESDDFFTLLRLFPRYIKFNNLTYSLIISCWILASYMFPMFSYLPYLAFRAEKGSGKGTCLNIISRVAWNPTDKVVATKEAPLFRMIKKAKPTLIIDEYHRLVQNPIMGAAVEAIMEAGSESDGVVYRCDPNDPDKVYGFYVYCPKVIASRKSTEIEEKAITIILSKTNDLKYAQRRKELEHDQRLERIREGLLRTALNVWEEVYKVYNELKPTKYLTGRDFQYWAPILAVAKVMVPDKYGEVLKFSEDYVRSKFEGQFEIEDIVLTTLYHNYTGLLEDVLQEDRKTISMKMKDLKEQTIQYSGTKGGLHHNTIYSALTNLGLLKQSRAGNIYLNAEVLFKLFEERGYKEEETEPQEEPSEDEKLEEHEEEEWDFSGLLERD